jgi:hypothetical protein
MIKYITISISIRAHDTQQLGLWLGLGLLKLRVCTHPARYLWFLLVGAISEKMARAFPEGVTTSKKRVLRDVD